MNKDATREGAKGAEASLLAKSKREKICISDSFVSLCLNGVKLRDLANL